jgi:hypothetical protein
MAGNKYLKQTGGVLQEVASSQTSAGAGDAGKIPALNASGVLDSTIVNSTVTSAGAGDAGKLPALDGSGHIDVTVLPTGVGPETKTILASEALTAGNLVNIYNNAGTANCRKADASAASAGKIAHGFVLANVSNGANATVYLAGINNQLSGMTVGDEYLSTAGAVVSTPATTSGYTSQKVGVAISATELAFQPTAPIILA